ncbi:MAG: FmdB family transcriptional regulator [Acidimicrobiales bacterium]|nr:FmdB family transcriptional regulator [Acidimicrobiales bacterium]
MPTYEYRCRDCGQSLEVVQRFTDDALTECPACGGDLRKVFGNIGISFKGSGFYKTDSRSKSSSTTPSSTSPSSTSPSSSDAASGSPSTDSSSGASSTPAPSTTPAPSSTPAPSTTSAA